MLVYYEIDRVLMAVRTVTERTEIAVDRRGI